MEGQISGVSQRIASISESATMAITAKANELKAAGHQVIGFGAGEPDFATPDHIVEAAVAAARNPAMHKYTPAPGLGELREAVAGQAGANSDVTSANVMITNGGKQAVYATIQCLVDPGDEVILPAPYWVTYPSAVSLADGVTVPIRTDVESGFKVTVDQLEAARTERTKLLIFVSPSNPTGAVYTAGEVRDIGQWAVDSGIWVMTDEIYQHLIYGDARFASLPVEVPELAQQCVVVNGVAKTYAMTGWRVGWMIGPVEIIRGATKLQSHTTSNVSNVSQVAALAALRGGLADVERMRKAFDRRRQTMYSMLDAMNGVTCIEPHGAFYCFPSMTGALGRPINGRVAATTLDLAELAITEAGVAFVPGEAFGAPGYARISYSLAEDDLVTGMERLGQMLA